MTTTIKKRISARDMVNIFNNHSDKVNVKYFTAINFEEQDDDIDNVYTYNIDIRHNEDIDPVKQFNEILKSIKA